jgi:TolA-binding protein
MQKLCFLILMSTLLVSCFKTAEQIQREKKVDQMSVQYDQSSKIIADLQLQVKDLQNRLANTTGQLEEIDHLQKEMSEKQKKTLNELVAQLSEQVNLLILESKNQKADIQKLQAEINKQKAYTKKVTKSLSKITDTQPSYANANKLFEANKMREAQAMYEEVLAAGKINAAQRNAVRYNLGLINYWNKKYDDSAAYFSQIYTKWPKSSYAHKSLLYIARCFDKMGKKAESKAAYGEIIKKYPKSSSASKAKKEMN